MVVDVIAEITNSVDVQDGLTNGASCIVKHFDYRVEGSNRCIIIWVKFSDFSIGKNVQTNLHVPKLYKPGICKSWTPIIEITRMFKIHINGTYQVKRKQFPLLLSAAKTIDKSQCSTMTNAVVHFAQGEKEQVPYIGMSRVTCLKNLHILHSIAKRNCSVNCCDE